MPKEIKKASDSSTESKIKEAARSVFHRKGFAGTKTRDIAKEAGINLALLNYYFRSKQKLFDIIMLETMQGFLQSMTLVFHDETTSLEVKLEAFADRYIELLIREPEIPLFIMSELRNNPQDLHEKINAKEFLLNSCFMRQYIEAMKEKQGPEFNPLHLLMNLIGLTVFPFIASPLLKNIGHMNNDEFNALMRQRKKLIPMWIKSMLDTK